MDDKTKQAINVIEQLAIGALSNGLLKRFQDVNALQSAIEHIKKVVEDIRVKDDN